MTKEIKCPKCGEIFQVDEMGYAMIVKQIRDMEFARELKKRVDQFEKDKLNAVEKAVSETEKAFITNIALNETEITKLKASLKSEQILKKS